MIIANTQVSNPPPALETIVTASGLKFFSLVYARRSLIMRSVMASLSYCCRLFRKSPAPSISFAPAQLISFSFFRICTHSHVFCTAGGGLENALISVMSSFFKFLSASAAASSAGIAFARSSSASCFSTAMRAESTLSCSSFAAAAVCLVSTSAVLCVITSRSSFTSTAFAFTSTFALDRSVCIVETSVAAWISFCRPPSRRAEKSLFRPLCSTKLRL